MTETFLTPRIWRCGELHFLGDEVLQAPDVHTDAFFERIKSHGFDGVWMRGRLHDLMHTTVLPQLNDARRDERIDALRTVIARGQKHGVGVYLFFNEPLAVDTDHEVFKAHPDIAGRRFPDPIRDRNITALCTSTQKVMDYMREAVGSVFDALADLAGIILITASELPTHCWSRSRRRLLNDGEPDDVIETNLGCPRCVDREPCDMVGELVKVWTDAAAARTPSPKVIAWNWSWSMWYEDPQREVIEQLPQRAELMADFERGDTRAWRDRTIDVDEYSLGFVGPSARFLKSAQVAADRNLPINAKLQLGATHEIASVPNIPVVGNLHAKGVGLHREGVAGAMGCWNFGCFLTLNTAAVGLFASDPDRYADRDVFFADLASRHLGVDDAAPLAAAWDAFARAMTLYPFSTTMLYWSPINYAPGYPFKLTYEGRKLGPSWRYHEHWGDDFSSCLGPFTHDEVTEAFGDMAAIWRSAAGDYAAALARGSQREHCDQESHTAQMIGLQLQSTANIFKWNRWRGEGREAVDAEARAIVDSEIETLEAALPLVDADERLGFHQEAQHRWYHGDNLREKLEALRTL